MTNTKRQQQQRRQGVLWSSLIELCENNGIDTSHFQQKARHVSRLESFQIPSFQLADITSFPVLKELCILHQPAVKSLTPLTKCKTLAKLWVTECSISSLDGLSTCQNLKELVVSSNNISSLHEIRDLTKLEKLWANDNNISSLSNISNLTHLASLWVARNKIAAIGPCLDSLQKLEELNLSCNQIGKFRELLNLSRLGALRDLYFTDPHFGSNPVCQLCNYKTYVMYHLGHLNTLDGHLVERSAVQLAEATYMKKKMYYNMRIKTVKRNLTNVLKRASTSCRYSENHIQTTIKKLEEQLRCIEAARMDISRKAPNSTGNIMEDEEEEDIVPEWSTSENLKNKLGITSTAERQLVSKQRALHSYINLLRTEAGQCRAEFHSLKRQVCQIADNSIQRHITELETGGNVRFEEESVSERAFHECELFVQAAFNSDEFQGSGICGVRVTRVVKVHNKWVRNRFNDTILTEFESKYGSDTEGYQNHMKLECSDTWFGKQQTVLEHKTRPSSSSNQDNIVSSNRWDSTSGTSSSPTQLQECSTNITTEDALEECSSPDLSNIVLVNHLIYFGDGDDENNKTDIVSHNSATCSRNLEHVAAQGFEQIDHDPFSSLGELEDSATSDQIQLYNSLKREQWRGKQLQELKRLENPNQEKLESATYDNELNRVTSEESILESLRCGTLLIAKTVIGATSFNPSSQLDGQKLSNLGTTVNEYVDDPSCLNESQIPLDAVLQDKNLVYTIADHRLIVPEYIVEVEYIFEQDHDTSQSSDDDEQVVVEGKELDDSTLSTISQEDIETELQRMLRVVGSEEARQRERTDMMPFLRPLVRYLRQPSRSVRSAKARKVAKERDEIVQSLIALEPTLSPRPKYLSMTNDSLLKTAGAQVLEHICYLNFHGSNLQEVCCLEGCRNLQTLILSFNELTRFEATEGLQKLQVLDIGFNAIQKVKNLKALKGLKHFRADNNFIESFEDLFSFRHAVPGTLRTLNLRNNPLCVKRSYIRNIALYIPNLVELDGNLASQFPRSAMCNQPSISETLILQHATFTPNSSKQSMKQNKMIQVMGKGSSSASLSRDEFDRENYSPRWASWGSTTAPKTQRHVKKSEKPLNQLHETARLESVEEVTLNHLGLEKLEGLNQLVNLRKLVLIDNDIQRIEGLENCTLLEELCLEENKIVRINGLANLKHLRKLDIGKNRLSTIDWAPIRDLRNLTQLSIEDNSIESLAPLSVLENLLELYACNNQISVAKEVQHLRALTKLIILDLSGNPVSKTNDYRLYTVYHLRQIKVLDGAGIDRNEQNRARAQYSGKLTVDFLHEKIGHQYFEHIRELDLSSCRIRDIEKLSGDEFLNLKEINLSDNLMSSLAGLYKLPLLEKLQLDNNRFESMYLPNEVDDNELIECRKAIEHKAQSQAIGQGIHAISNIVTLCMSGNSITDIRHIRLSLLPKLRVLSLHNNEITNLGGLDSCTQLRELNLGRNKLRTLEALEQQAPCLTQLSCLHLEENGIRTLCNFALLPNLKLLTLSSNRINDMSEIIKLEGAMNLQDISMFANPIARRPLYRQSLINTIHSVTRIDGKTVSVDERDRVVAIFAEATNLSGAVILSAANARALAGVGAGRSVNNSVLDYTSSQVRVPIRMTSVNLEALSQVSGRTYGSNSNTLPANGITTLGTIGKTPSLPSFGSGASRSTVQNNSGGGSARGRGQVSFQSNRNINNGKPSTPVPPNEHTKSAPIESNLVNNFQLYETKSNKQTIVRRKYKSKFGSSGPVLLPSKPGERSSGPHTTVQAMLRPASHMPGDRGTTKFKSGKKTRRYTSEHRMRGDSQNFTPR